MRLSLARHGNIIIYRLQRRLFGGRPATGNTLKAFVHIDPNASNNYIDTLLCGPVHIIIIDVIILYTSQW